MFNTDTPLSGQVTVQISQSHFSCSQSFLNTSEYEQHEDVVTANRSDVDPIDTTYLHQCIVSDLSGQLEEGQNQLPYSILLGDVYIKRPVEVQGYNVTILFQGRFRVPAYSAQMQMLVFGDWGEITQIGLDMGYVDIVPCLSQTISDHPQVMMIILTGDMAYDMSGPTYYSFLKYIDVITARIVFMVTPGNHDTQQHTDTFELFTQSFKMPQWDQYFNYFYTFQFGPVLFMAFNPQRQTYGQEQIQRINQSMPQVFKQELTDEFVNYIKDNTFSIVFSHYPIFCSDIYDHSDTCVQDPTRFLTERSYFSRLGMDLYFSGHVHVYERSRPICPNSKEYGSATGPYSMDCPIYTVEGAAGNNYYVQTQQQYPQMNFSASIVRNTGFGILTFKSESQSSIPYNVSYRHISAPICNPKDSFVMLSNLNDSDSQRQSHKLLAILAIFIILGTIGLIVGSYCYRRKARANDLNKERDPLRHVQMVEENFETPNLARD